MRGLRTGPSHNQNLFLLLQKPLLLSSHLARKTLQPAVNGSKMLARTVCRTLGLGILLVQISLVSGEELTW